MERQVYSYAKIDNIDTRAKVYNELLKGKSRFGMWDQNDSLQDNWYGKHAFLLRIKKDDWVVHVNMPTYGKCVAAKVIEPYQFDEGIKGEWGKDFNNFVNVDTNSIIEFDRNDSNILPSVNLNPRSRYQRILKVDDFFESLENLKDSKYNNIKKSDRSTIHLQGKIDQILPQITSEIHQMNKSKELENFVHRVFEKIPNTNSYKNGFGWGTDNGADLIIEFENPIIGINITTKLIVQVKSYEGNHFDKNAIDQIVEGIKKFDANAGLLITTANETEEIEDYIREKSEEIGKSIDIIAGNDVAKFFLRYAPELLVG